MAAYKHHQRDAIVTKFHQGQVGRVVAQILIAALLLIPNFIAPQTIY